LPPERKTGSDNRGSLTQGLEKRSTLTSDPVGVGMVKQSKMNSDLNIPHKRVPIKRALLAKDEGGLDYARQLAHELRTPLNAIIGLCQCLERDQETPLTADQRDAVTRMQRNAHALSESINRLLERVRAGSH